MLDKGQLNVAAGLHSRRGLCLLSTFNDDDGLKSICQERIDKQEESIWQQKFLK